MKQNVLGPKVVGVDVVVILEDEKTKEYAVYLWNHREDIIEGVIITSTGFGEDLKSFTNIKTATLRHSLEVLLPNEVAKIETIVPEVFSIYNEYWVSFWIEDVLYDKQFLFPPESIIPSRFKLINQFGKKGILAQ